MAKMFLMCGRPGSGKSTYAKELAKQNHYRYLSIDDTYAAFNGDPTLHENKFDVWITFFRQIHAVEVAGQDVVVDTNAPTYCDRAEFLNWFSDFEHHLIWVDALQKLCLENNEKRSRVIPKEQMEKLFMLFEPPLSFEYAGTGRRSMWKSISWIENTDNHFRHKGMIYGEFPSDVKDVIE